MSRINKISIWFFITLFALTIYGLFTIKNNVMMLKSELSEVKRQIKLEKDSLHVLKAEMAYLASPERLSKLNKNYLKLQGTNTKQLVQNPLMEESAKLDGRSSVIAKNDNAKSSKRIIISEEKALKSSEIIKTSYNGNLGGKYGKKYKAVKWRYKKGPSKYTEARP